MTLRLGRYETIAPIARGGMATVYAGRAVGAGGFERRVAIKVMHPHIAEDPAFITMFLDEARLAARIHHPNVVSTLDVQKTDDAMFLVMELVRGASLRDVARALRSKERRMPLGMALRILLDVLSGLHAAHELEGRDGRPLHLVHRDVSPHNILVGSDGISRITDFGVARAEARLTTTRGSHLKGKLAYMPPEQGRGDPIDRRADVYAAGVCLWEVLTGRRLFHAEHEGELVLKVLEGAQTSPQAYVPDLHPAVDAVCMAALAIDPEQRPPTAAAFAEQLEEAATQAGVTLASNRAVARFVEEFRVEIKSLPPPSADDPSVRDAASQPSSPSRARVLDEATMPEVSETQLTGIGDRPASGRRSDPRQTILAIGAAAMVFGASAVAITMTKDRPRPSVPAASALVPRWAASMPAAVGEAVGDTAASDAPTTHPKAMAPSEVEAEEVAAPSSSAPAEAPSDEADAATEPVPSARDAAPTPPRLPPPVARPWPKRTPPPAPPPAKPSGGGPLDYEPDGL
ncbi:MAG: protein kinase [Myxococcota bacterium]